ncbi:MAG: hybrid sensor histidine kinase/response regulator [Deltaproteobacteria bacterium]|nr:hybrid sensor histidine kinase/response regulator [Deltaproteobacteria bacterium]
MKNRLLIIDDTPSDIKVLSNALHDEYAVSVATSGAEGMALVNEPYPDLILLDIIMPGMDGFAVLQALKKNPVTRHIPVIFLTVIDAAQDKVKGFAGGAVDYILKPFEIMEVKARVRTHLRLQEAQAQLAAQNKELLEAAKLRDEVERIYRHDLKNPLTAVLGNSELLLMMGGLDDEHLSKVEAIHSAGLTMLNMINRYFDLFKIEQGMYVLRPNAVDLGKIITRVLADMANMINCKKLFVDFTMGKNGKDEVIISGEDMLCYTMVANLIKNAVEASLPGGKLQVRLRAGESAELEVENSGEIPAAIRPYFFDKYVTAGKDHGTGLGTYSAKLLVELQQGKIELNTTVAGRTTVRVSLPTWN